MRHAVYFALKALASLALAVSSGLYAGACLALAGLCAALAVFTFWVEV